MVELNWVCDADAVMFLLLLVAMGADDQSLRHQGKINKQQVKERRLQTFAWHR